VSDRPVLRVVSGDATAEEIAAVVAAVSCGLASSAPADEAPRAATSVWAARGYGHRNIRATFTPSPDGWRTSFWPR
jgi:hypothetical protein